MRYYSESQQFVTEVVHDIVILGEVVEVLGDLGVLQDEEVGLGGEEGVDLHHHHGVHGLDDASLVLAVGLRVLHYLLFALGEQVEVLLLYIEVLEKGLEVALSYFDVGELGGYLVYGGGGGSEPFGFQVKFPSRRLYPLKLSLLFRISESTLTLSLRLVQILFSLVLFHYMIHGRVYTIGL